MIGYKYESDGGTGCVLNYVYINNLGGLLPGILVQMLANKMMKKGIFDVEIAIKKYHTICEKHNIDPAFT
jgi:hypothetical protein